jgi:hypothetical protein
MPYTHPYLHIRDVVVAVIDTPPVWASSKCFRHILDVRGSGCNIRDRDWIRYVWNESVSPKSLTGYHICRPSDISFRDTVRDVDGDRGIWAGRLD